MPRRPLAVLATVAALLAALLAPALASAGVTVHYEPANGNEKSVQRLLESKKFLEDQADAIRKSVELPGDLNLVARHCGEVNAFYNRDDQTVTLCYELVLVFAGVHIQDAEQQGDGDTESAIAAALGATEFAMNHEIGHALVHLLELPITGKEEDAVDQFSTFVLVKDGDEHGIEAAMAGAHTWMLMTKPGQQHTNDEFADEHSLNEQRFYNITCWVYGSDPEGFKELVQDDLLPQERAEQCPDEWAKMANSWERLLGPHYKGTPPAN